MPCSPKPFEIDDLRVTYKGQPGIEGKVEINMSGKNIQFEIEDNKLTITIPEVGALIKDIVDKWTSWRGDKGGFSVEKFDSKPVVMPQKDPLELKYFDADYLSHPGIKEQETSAGNGHASGNLELGRVGQVIGQVQAAQVNCL